MDWDPDSGVTGVSGAGPAVSDSWGFSYETGVIIVSLLHKAAEGSTRWCMWAQGVVPRRGLGHGPESWEWRQGRETTPPSGQGWCQVPKDSSLLRSQLRGPAVEGPSKPGAAIPSPGSWLGSLKPSPPVTVVTNY